MLNAVSIGEEPPMYIEPIRAAPFTDVSVEFRRTVIGVANGLWMGALVWLAIGLAIIYTT
jgi:hypothetical protein